MKKEIDKYHQISKYMHGIKGKHISTHYIPDSIRIADCPLLKKISCLRWTHLLVLKLTINWMRSGSLMEKVHTFSCLCASSTSIWIMELHHSQFQSFKSSTPKKTQGTQHFHALKSWKPQLLEGPESSFATVTSLISSLVLQSLLCQPYSTIKLEQTHLI